MSKTRRKISAISAFLLLSGCGEQELSSCVASTEQVILLRQMAMTPKQKEVLDFCISNPGLGRGYLPCYISERQYTRSDMHG
jgi:hypothetical protein